MARVSLMASCICVHRSSRLRLRSISSSLAVRLSVYVCWSGGGHVVVSLLARLVCLLFVCCLLVGGLVIVLRRRTALWSDPMSM